MKIIGIAGGSGAGKSTVSYALIDARSELFEVLHLDDYHRHRNESNLPMLHGMINWDHPDIIRWNDLLSDLEKLRHGNSITVDTKAHRLNPEYTVTRTAIPRIVGPKPIILVEGYLSLYHPALLKLFDKSFYLDLEDSARMQRRDKQKLVGGLEYDKKVLEPMHKQFVEPTKKAADIIIDVSQKSMEQVRDYILTQLI